MSEKLVIVVGDKTSHGGIVLTGNDSVEISDKLAACVGDKVSCPLHGESEIIEGFAPISLQPTRVLAFEGCKTSCGAVLIGGEQTIVYVDIDTEENLPLLESQLAHPISAPPPALVIPMDKHVKPKPIDQSGNHHWKNPDNLPDNIKYSLKIAMKKENIPDKNYHNLAWIMAQESNGKIGIRNSASSARGLYQITKANYHYNPKGELSFGDAIDECIGGIRYIFERYGNTDKAVEFWKAHLWY